MKQTKIVSPDNNLSIVKPMTRHESWKNRRKHTAPMLMRFS